MQLFVNSYKYHLMAEPQLLIGHRLVMVLGQSQSISWGEKTDKWLSHMICIVNLNTLI